MGWICLKIFKQHLSVNLMKWRYLLILLFVLLILALAIVIFIMNNKTELKSKCCAECINGFQSPWATAPYCVNTSKMSVECLDYLNIQDLTGISTIEAYANHCK
jgi:hypothetical protein